MRAGTPSAEPETSRTPLPRSKAAGFGATPCRLREALAFALQLLGSRGHRSPHAPALEAIPIADQRRRAYRRSSAGSRIGAPNGGSRSEITPTGIPPSRASLAAARHRCGGLEATVAVGFPWAGP